MLTGFTVHGAELLHPCGVSTYCFHSLDASIGVDDRVCASPASGAAGSVGAMAKATRAGTESVYSEDSPRTCAVSDTSGPSTGMRESRSIGPWKVGNWPGVSSLTTTLNWSNPPSVSMDDGAV